VIDAQRLERRMNELARIGGSGTAVSRLGLSAEEQQARDLVGGWLALRGAKVRRDPAANLFARFGGAGPALLVGSHLDSVPEGGRFDGALGVLCAVEAVESLLDAGKALRRPIEVVAWADEEGARFGVGLFGSSASFGRLPPNVADRRDQSGISVREALVALGESGDPTEARRDPREWSTYLEVHIEQGPRLERAGVALGIVSLIVGIFHGRLTVRGRADHAGATVMGARRDALVAASELVIALERMASSVPDAVGTVGEIAVRPGAKNVVPGECRFSVDIRAPSEDGVERVLGELRQDMTRVRAERGVEVEIDTLHRVPVTPLDPSIQNTLRDATAAAGVAAPTLVSGAGHDAQNSQLAGVPTGMIFVRSTGGSHTRRESASVGDAVAGAQALARAIEALAS
jgi:allantoate deiminase